MPAPERADRGDAGDPAPLPCGNGLSFRLITDPRIAAAMRFAEARLDAPMTTVALAAAVGLSQFHFLRLFQAQTGETVSDYGRRIRLDAAARTLRTSPEAIVSIALSVGYGSQAAFTRAFTARFGRSPASYRRGIGRAVAVDGARQRAVAIRSVGAIHCLGRRYLGLRPGRSAPWHDFLSELPPDSAARRGRLLQVVHDDPRVTPPAQIRVDCCVVGAERPGEARDLAARGFLPFRIVAGTYAAIAASGTEAGFGGAEDDLLDIWLARQARYRLRGGAGRLEFHDAAAAQPNAGEIFVPIRAVGMDGS